MLAPLLLASLPLLHAVLHRHGLQPLPSHRAARCSLCKAKRHVAHMLLARCRASSFSFLPPFPPSRACVHAHQDLYELGTTMRGRYIADRFFEEYNKELKKVRVA